VCCTGTNDTLQTKISDSLDLLVLSYYNLSFLAYEITILVLNLVFFPISNTSLTLGRFLCKFPGHAENLIVYSIEKISELWNLLPLPLWFFRRILTTLSVVKYYVTSVKYEWKNSKHNVWNDADRRISKCAKKKHSPPTFFNKSLEWKGLGSNPTLHLERQTNKSVTHDTA
jgi:hypothetical protein